MAGPQDIKDHGWRQGSVLPAELASRLAAPRVAAWGPDDRAVLLSQDCDVVHGSYEAEPTVELIRARVESAEDAVIRHGRNPRHLQIETATGILLNLSVHDRWVVARSELESHAPDPLLAVDGGSLHVLVAWIAKETLKLRSKRAHSFLAREFHQAFGRAPGGQAKADALSVLEGIALHDRGACAASLRTTEHEGHVYIDLANAQREVVQVDPAGWRIVRGDIPVRFVRPKAMAALPRPERGGHVDELRPLVNIKREHHFRVLVAWLLGALRPRGPYPILCVQGEAGSAKSMLSRIARTFVDPNVSPLRTVPRDERDLAIASRGAHVIAYENLSGIPQWLSDALCRVSTGGGFSTRQLCTDDEEVVFDYVRPVLVNGIDDLAVQPDLADRCLVVALRRIADAERRCEKDLLSDLAGVAPRVFGALLDALACALKRVDVVQLPTLPRMADFARFVTAAEPALGWADGAFMEAYAANRTDVAAAALDASAVAHARR